MLTIMTTKNSTPQVRVPLNTASHVEESFPMLMSTCVKYMRESLNARFAEQGASISSEQWIVLTHLTHQDGISQQDLARRCSRTEVSILNLLKKLEAAGFVLRVRDPVDARSNRVFLTSEGRKQQRGLFSVAQENLARMSEGVDQGEIDQFMAILRKIIQNAQQAHAESRKRTKTT